MATKATSDLNDFNDQTSTAYTVSGDSRMTQKQVGMREGSGCLSPSCTRGAGKTRKCTSCDTSPINGFLPVLDFMRASPNVGHCGFDSN